MRFGRKVLRGSVLGWESLGPDYLVFGGQGGLEKVGFVSISGHLSSWLGCRTKMQKNLTPRSDAIWRPSIGGGTVGDGKARRKVHGVWLMQKSAESAEIWTGIQHALLPSGGRI